MADPVTLIVLVAAGGAANGSSVSSQAEKPGVSSQAEKPSVSSQTEKPSVSSQTEKASVNPQAEKSGDATAAAMARTARDALGGGASVDVREVTTEPTDDDALALEKQSHATAIVECIWDDVERLHATLRIHWSGASRWVERSIGFTPSDPAVERGRSLGFAVAATMPEASSQPRLDDTTEAASNPKPATDGEKHSPASPPPPPPSTSRPVASTEAPGPEREEARMAGGSSRVEMDVLAVGAIGVAGADTGAGGGAAVRWLAARELSLRLAASERTGSLDVAAANILTVALAAGVSLRLLPPSRGRALGFTVRADYLALYQSVTHFDSDDPRPVAHNRWLSGIDAYADASWQVSSDVAVLAGPGLEEVFGPTYVDVKGKSVAVLPSLRAVAEIGFSIRF